MQTVLSENFALLSGSDNTNFIYEITGLNPAAIDTINAIDEKPKIAQRIAAIQEAGGQITFLSTKSRKLQLNLQMIDSHLPHILATMLLIKYTSKGAVILAELVKRTTAINPIDFDLGFGHPFYEYKIKNFLTDVALGMTPASTWKGKYDATGGIIIVKQSGELVCYHIYNRNEFQEYLLHNTRFEQASTSRYHFGNLYLDGNRICLNLNLQVRFN